MIYVISPQSPSTCSGDCKLSDLAESRTRLTIPPAGASYGAPIAIRVASAARSTIC